MIGLAGPEECKNKKITNTNAHAANAGTTTALAVVYTDATKSSRWHTVFLVMYKLWRCRLSEREQTTHFCSTLPLRARTFTHGLGATDRVLLLPLLDLGTRYEFSSGVLSTCLSTSRSPPKISVPIMQTIPTKTKAIRPKGSNRRPKATNNADDRASPKVALLTILRLRRFPLTANASRSLMVH